VPHEGNYSSHTITVKNARGIGTQLDLDRQGFQLLKHSTKVTDFYDDALLHIYETEVKDLLRKATGASDVTVFDHTRRSSSAQVRSVRNIREASSVIHNDYSSTSGTVRLQDHLRVAGDAKQDDAMNRDFAIVNVWRSINGKVMNHHLAMCDATSVPESDLIPVKREGKERMGEIQLMLHGPSHAWYYFPLMTFSEALVFKTFDSRQDGRTRFTAHTAIEDPNAPTDAPPRESIETRCFVFF